MTFVHYDDPTVPVKVIVDPRIKQRWVDTQRAQGRRRFRIVLVGAGLAAALGAAVGVLYSPLFEVRHVRVQGAVGPAVAQVQAAAAVAHQSLIEVHPDAVAGRIEALPWVDDASVQTQWPGTVRVEVHSRTAVAQVLLSGTSRALGDRARSEVAGSQVALLDVTGRVLASPQAPVQGLPVVSGVAIDGLRPGEWVAGAPGGIAPRGSSAALLTGPPSAIAGALAISANLPPVLTGAVQAITVKGGQLQAVVTGATATAPVTVLFGDQQQLADKITALATIVQQGNLAGIGEIDVRLPARPALTPRQSTTNVSTQAGG